MEYNITFLLSITIALPMFVYSLVIINRAYQEYTNLETFVSRNLKFHTFGDLHTTKKC